MATKMWTKKDKNAQEMKMAVVRTMKNMSKVSQGRKSSLCLTVGFIQVPKAIKRPQIA